MRDSVVLPQPGLADEAEHLALVDVEIDVVDGANRAADRARARRRAAGTP